MDRAGAGVDLIVACEIHTDTEVDVHAQDRGAFDDAPFDTEVDNYSGMSQDACRSRLLRRTALAPQQA